MQCVQPGSGVPGFVPGGPVFGECHGCISFANDFCYLIQQLGELLELIGGQILAESGMEAPSRFNRFTGDARHHADQFNFLAGLVFFERSIDRGGGWL